MNTSSVGSPNNAGCLTAFVAAFSRILLLMFWIGRPVAWDTVFQTAIWPCLGFLFLPFTTLMYAWLMQGVGTIQGLDWLWLILAILIDVANLGTAGYANRNRVPGYSADAVTPPPAAPPPAAPPTTPAS